MRPECLHVQHAGFLENLEYRVVGDDVVQIVADEYVAGHILAPPYGKGGSCANDGPFVRHANVAHQMSSLRSRPFAVGAGFFQPDDALVHPISVITNVKEG